MRITIEHFPGERPQFNVSLSSGEGKQPFITIKGCRIVDGSNGPFISWPARKLDTGKYWNHVYASDAFSAAVLAEAQKTQTKAAPKSRNTEADSDIPF
jgi:DNA-binding cell septation regulator SpoVG